jgi:hypothetical protein
LKVATLRLAGGGGSAELLVSGAMAARARHDYPLTERLARAAIEVGADFEARFMAAETAHLLPGSSAPILHCAWWCSTPWSR